MNQYSNNAARERGLELLEQLHGGHAGEAMVNELKDICPDLVDMTLEWALTGIMGRPGLDLLTRELLIVASCVTLGASAALQLKAHIDSALKLGATREQVVETILTMLFYAGGVNVSNAFRHAKEVFQQHNL
jgi:4-carboxymuconolactone decarboxylase